MQPSNSLRETDIRPDHLMDEQACRFQADVARLLARRDEFVEVPCPACGGKDMRHNVMEKYSIDYVMCRDCETVYVNPRPTPAILEMYYATSENYAYWNEHIFPSSEAVRREKIFRPRVQRVLEICEKYGVSYDTLLEVGAGFGTFCEEMKQVGAFKHLIAVEPTPDLAATCRKRGLTVIEKPIEQVELESGSVNVAVSFEVIEHLFAPIDYVAQCYRILSPGGILVVTCPNVKGFDVMTLREHSSAVDPEHLNYFHPASLARLLERCGFETLEIQTPGQLDAELVRKKALSGDIDLTGQPFLHQVLVEEWEAMGEMFQRFLVDAKLSSHMWIVARKPVHNELGVSNAISTG